MKGVTHNIYITHCCDRYTPSFAVHLLTVLPSPMLYLLHRAKGSVIKDEGKKTLSSRFEGLVWTSSQLEECLLLQTFLWLCSTPPLMHPVQILLCQILANHHRSRGTSTLSLSLTPVTFFDQLTGL